MRVLFICSQNSDKGISPVVNNQIISIKREGVEVDVFGIRGKGILGYLMAIIKLKKIIRKSNFHIYHAHYGLSAIAATIAGARPLIVSLMGSDVKKGGWQKGLIRKYVKRRWYFTIVKSQELADLVGKKYCHIIPNGVDLNRFEPLSINECKERLKLDHDIKYVLFAANPKRPEKNFNLVKNAFNRLEMKQTKLIYLDNILYKDIPYWMNAANVVVLSSFWEGSPNVIKEAMACNRPIISTNVGDVEWLFDGVTGCFLSDFNEDDFIEKLLKAIRFSQSDHSTIGRDRIHRLGLDASQQAKKIISLYNSILV